MHSFQNGTGEKWETETPLTSPFHLILEDDGLAGFQLRRGVTQVVMTTLSRKRFLHSFCFSSQSKFHLEQDKLLKEDGQAFNILIHINKETKVIASNVNTLCVSCKLN